VAGGGAVGEVLAVVEHGAGGVVEAVGLEGEAGGVEGE